MGALFLRELDERFAASGLFYIRYMDDVVVLTPTRWKLRRAVALLNGIFTTLGLAKHPNKTFIGRVEKGFDFLGYCLWPDRLTVAQATVERFLARVTRLYEQEGETADQRRSPSGCTCDAGSGGRGQASLPPPRATCQFRLGRRQSHEAVVHTAVLHISSDPVPQLLMQSSVHTTGQLSGVPSSIQMGPPTGHVA